MEKCVAPSLSHGFASESLGLYSRAIFVYCIMGAGSLMVILPILYVCCQCDEWSCCTYQQDPTSEKHEAAAQKQRSKEGVYGPSV